MVMVKNSIGFLMIMGLVLAGWVLAKPASARDLEEVGRYQLFQGSYTSIDLKRQQTATHAGVFLIDTKTGKVKRYLNKIDEQGNYIETWVTTETGKP